MFFASFKTKAGAKVNQKVKKYFAKFVELGLLNIEGKNKGRKYTLNRI